MKPQNDFDHYLPQEREGYHYFVVHPWDERREKPVFVTAAASETALRSRLVALDGYDRCTLELVPVTWAEAYQYAVHQSSFRFVGFALTDGYYYLELPGHEPMFVHGCYLQEELLAITLEKQGIDPGLLWDERTYKFWLPADRYDEYRSVCRTAA